MTLTVNRFETKTIKRGIEDVTVTVKNDTTIFIKDHATDNVVAFIQLENSVEKNTELAERIIGTIEDWIEEHEN